MKELQIQTLRETELSKKEYFPALFTYTLFITACIKIIFSGFSMIASFWWLYAGFSVLLGGILLLIPMGKVREYLLPAGLVLTGILFFAGFSYSRNGLCVLGNEYLDFLTRKNAAIYLDFPTNGTSGAFYVAALGCGILVLIFTELIRRKRKPVLCLIAILCLTGCGVGLFKTDYGVFILIAALICSFFSENYRIGNPKGIINYVTAFAGIAGICALVTLLSVSLMQDHFSTKHIFRALEQKLHQTIYDEGTNAMPEGNLKNLTYFKRSSEPALILTTKEPQKFYLRGMVGEIYTGNAWESLAEETYLESEDLFYWLHKNDFYGYTSIASAMSLAGAKEQYELTVANVSACQEHQYLPYTLSDCSLLDASKISEENVAATEESAMTYSYYAGSLPQWYEAYMYLTQNSQNKRVQEYLKSEQSYRDHAYTYDLQLTNSVIGVMERIFGTEKKERSLAEIMVLVRETLEHNLEYKENVTTPTGKNDFIKYSLEQSRQGYSVHYATAAAMMFRYFGVPARYVEGYYLSSEEVKNYGSMEEITLTEGHAHAWTEIYLDGIGWIPFEVTPGYIDEEELAAAEQVISDGIGEGSGKSYSGSSLSYKPPKQQEDEQKAPEREHLFRFEVKDVLSLLLIIFILLLLYAVYRILRKHHRLNSFLREMQDAPNRDAITGLFSYSSMLLERCHITSSLFDNMEELNAEARFSNHGMTDEQRKNMEQFMKHIVSKCKKNLSPWKKFYYHYILWLYR